MRHLSNGTKTSIKSYEFKFDVSEELSRDIFFEAHFELQIGIKIRPHLLEIEDNFMPI
jgi:hypothetical protein